MFINIFHFYIFAFFIDSVIDKGDKTTEDDDTAIITGIYILLCIYRIYLIFKCSFKSDKLDCKNGNFVKLCVSINICF